MRLRVLPIQSKEYSILLPKALDGDWKLHTDESAIFFCGVPSPIANPFGNNNRANQMFRQKLWDDTKILLGQNIIETNRNEWEIKHRQPKPLDIEKCSQQLHHILEIAKIFDLYEFPDNSKVEQMLLLFYDNPGHTNIIAKYIDWVRTTYILEDYFPQSYPIDPDRFKGMEDIVGYDGPIY